MSMERKIIEILNTYKNIQNTKKEFKTNLFESRNAEILESFLKNKGWSVKSGQLNSNGDLDADFVRILRFLFDQFDRTNNKCKGQITAGNDLYHKKFNKSLHPKGLAIDVVLSDPSACKSNFLSLLNEYKNHPPYKGFSYKDEYVEKSEGWTGPHVHIQYAKGDGVPSDVSSVSDSGDLSLLNEPVKPADYDTIMGDVGKEYVKYAQGVMTEMFDSENIRVKSNGTIVYPSSKFATVYNDAFDGRIGNSIQKQDKCPNGFAIIERNRKYIAEYCGKFETLVRYDQSVKLNDKLIRTISDVYVTFYNKYGEKLKEIPEELLKQKKPKEFTKEPRKFEDPALAAIIGAPYYLYKYFQKKNQSNEKKGLTEERLNREIYKIKKLII